MDMMSPHGGGWNFFSRRCLGSKRDLNYFWQGNFEAVHISPSGILVGTIRLLKRTFSDGSGGGSPSGRATTGSPAMPGFCPHPEGSTDDGLSAPAITNTQQEQQHRQQQAPPRPPPSAAGQPAATTPSPWGLPAPEPIPMAAGAPPGARQGQNRPRNFVPRFTHFL